MKSLVLFLFLSSVAWAQASAPNKLVSIEVTVYRGETGVRLSSLKTVPEADVKVALIWHTTSGSEGSSVEKVKTDEKGECRISFDPTDKSDVQIGVEVERRLANGKILTLASSPYARQYADLHKDVKRGLHSIFFKIPIYPIQQVISWGVQDPLPPWPVEAPEYSAWEVPQVPDSFTFRDVVSSL